jgi:hypothetical protein
MYETFTQTPPEMRKLLMRIEAQNKGFKIIDDVVVDDNEQPVNEKTLAEVNKATDKAMLRGNPKMIEYNYEYKGGFFTSLDRKEITEKESKA